MEMTIERLVPLTAMDRCDRCGAQAYMVAVKEEASLYFCMHHKRENKDALCEQGWTIIDDKEAQNNLG